MIPFRPAAVICDMDGLLVDSERLERRVWQLAAREHGVEMSDERFATFIGHPIDECERMLAGYYGDSFDIAAYRATCHHHMRVIVDAEGVPLRPGAVGWLDFVASLGIPLGVATSSGPALVQERLGPHLHRFQAVVNREEVARGKPNPDLYLEAAARLGAAPASCLALEDSPTGARAAMAAAMPVIIVPDMVHPPAAIARETAGVYESLDAVRQAAALAWTAA
ncbi:MAG TPA: HAD family phosphatase [Gemmatimonadaceae bacterium]|nr:HAD family phosphatase [Gemmatimonadaceae bacterium]